MAARKNAGKLSAKPVPAAEKQTDIEEIDPIRDTLRRINDTAQQAPEGEWSIKVYDATGVGGRGRSGPAPFLFTCPLEDLPNLEVNLADAYPAGGTYRVMCRLDGALMKTFDLTIAQRHGYKAPPPSYLAGNNVMPAPAAPAVDPILMMLDRMAQMQLQAQEASERRFAAMMDTMAQRMTPAPAISAEDQLQKSMALFKMFKDMSPPANPDLSLKMLQDGIDLGKKIAGRSGGGDDEKGGGGIMDIIGRVLESETGKTLVTNLTQPPPQQRRQQQQGPQRPQLARPGQPGQRPTIVRPPSQQPAPTVQPPAPTQQPDQLAAGMQYLFTQAAAAADPALVADQVVEMVPAHVLDQLGEQDDIVSYLASGYPKVNDYREWFNALVAEIWSEEDIAGEPGEAGEDAETVAGTAEPQGDGGS